MEKVTPGRPALARSLSGAGPLQNLKDPLPDVQDPPQDVKSPPRDQPPRWNDFRPVRRVTDYGEFIQKDSPFCLTRTITRTSIGACYTSLSLAPRDAPRRCVQSEEGTT